MAKSVSFHEWFHLRCLSCCEVKHIKDDVVQLGMSHPGLQLDTLSPSEICRKGDHSATRTELKV